MAEKIKADIYIAYLDQMLAGKKEIGPVDDLQITKLLLLAKTMIEADLSLNSKLRENLRKQLLDQVTKKNKSSLSLLSRNDDELDEEALKQVTAAGPAGEQKENCPYCGSRSIKSEGKCPFCSH
jgi:rubrerythrin